jgi:methionyl aminopeptidase
MRRVGRVVRNALEEMRRRVAPGVSTGELDSVCARTFERHGARAAPTLVYGFPGTACISVNNEAVHGIPGPRRLEAGDLVKLDVTAELDGYFADAAITVPVPPVSPDRLRLARCAQVALRKATASATAERPVNVIGRSVQSEVERLGFSIMPALGGHGVGRTIHEAPSVHNYYAPWDDEPLTDGLAGFGQPGCRAYRPEYSQAG